MDAIHGGDVTGYQLRHGRPPLDFSASLNPLGMPVAVLEAARRAVGESVPYPDPWCRRLAAALAERLDARPENVFIGNGAADVIHRLAQAVRPRAALIPAPAFAEYEQALAIVGCETRFHPLREEREFRLGEDILPEIKPGLDLLFLCQPNNPTGQVAEPELLLAILRRATETGTLVAVDECFCHFVEQSRRYTLLGQIGHFHNLVLIDSFTKLYGMAGIRLGYAVSRDERLVAALHRAGQPWAVSTVAQEAGLAALSETAYVERSLAFLHAERDWLGHELERLGLRIFGSRANYLFFRAARADLSARLEDVGILIRDCGNFRGLCPGYYRVAVRLREENARLVEALRRL